MATVLKTKTPKSLKSLANSDKPVEVTISVPHTAADALAAHGYKSIDQVIEAFAEAKPQEKEIKKTLEACKEIFLATDQNVWMSKKYVVSKKETEYMTLDTEALKTFLGPRYKDFLKPGVRVAFSVAKI